MLRCSPNIRFLRIDPHDGPRFRRILKGQSPVGSADFEDARIAKIRGVENRPWHGAVGVDVGWHDGYEWYHLRLPAEADSRAENEQEEGGGEDCGNDPAPVARDDQARLGGDCERGVMQQLRTPGERGTSAERDGRA